MPLRRSIVVGAPLLLLSAPPRRLLTNKESTISAFGAIPNIDSDVCAETNRIAIAKAFAVADRVHVPGGRGDFYALAGGALVPEGCTIAGDGATFRMKGRGLEMGNYASSIGISYVGLRGTHSVHRASTKSAAPSTWTQQFALIQARGKVGCRIYAPYIGDAPINGVEISNCRFCEVSIERAFRFGDDDTFSPTEGSIVYAPGTTDASIHIGDGRNSYGLGAISLLSPARIRITGKISDTRRSAIFCAAGHPPGPGVVITNMSFYRMGGIAPRVPSASNHWQSTCAIFIPGAAKADYVEISKCLVEDWGETLIEGCVTIEDLKAKTSDAYDSVMKSPNPGALFGNMVIKGATIESYRGRGYASGGERGLAVNDISLKGVIFAAPRPTEVYGPPSYIHIQPIGEVVADNIMIQDCTGTDNSNDVTTGIVLSGSEGGRFADNCRLIDNQAMTKSTLIDPRVRQYGNNWSL